MAANQSVDQVVVAGDHDEIKQAVAPFGFEYINTGAHPLPAPAAAGMMEGLRPTLWSTCRR